MKQRDDSGTDTVDALWCAEQDAVALGEAPEGHLAADTSGDPRWALEDAMYDVLAEQALTPEVAPVDADMAIIAGALEAEEAMSAEVAAAPSERARSWIGPVVAIAAGLLVWSLWSGNGPTISEGSWVTQAEQIQHGEGQALPLAMWIAAESEACGTVEDATVCASPGTVVRISLPLHGSTPRIEVERGRVTVRSGTWTVVTAAGEQTLGAGDWATAPAVVLGTGASVPAVPVHPRRPSPLASKPVPAPEAEPAVDLVPEPPASPQARPAPADVASLLARARALRGQGDERGAGKAYAALIAAYPRSSEAGTARVTLGQLRLKAGRNRAALALFDRYLKRGGSLSPEALWGKIRALHALGRDKALEAAVAELGRRFPRSVYSDRAKALLSQ